MYTSVAALLHVDPGHFLRRKRLEDSKGPMADAYYQLLYYSVEELSDRRSFGHKSHSTELLCLDYGVHPQQKQFIESYTILRVTYNTYTRLASS